MSQPSPTPIKTFISYAQHDRKLVDRFLSHLALLSREGVIEPWVDREIPLGSNWRDAISKELKRSGIILLCISADYLASDYCYGIELKRALAMHDAGEAVVVPIILRPCDWHSAPFAKLQSLPRRPVTSYANIDEAFLEASRDIRRIALSALPSQGLSHSQSIELKIDREFDSFGEDEKRRLLEAIRKLLDLDKDVGVKVRRGSLLLRLRLSRTEVERLQRAAHDGELGEFNVVEAQVVMEEDQSATPTATDTRPKVFIGSSTEGLEIAETIQVTLDHLCEVTLWNQGIFAFGRTTLEVLTQKLQEYDYAVLVMTPDDFTTSRGSDFLSPRDNVIFELGLFMGFLGRDRTVIVFDRTADLKIPTDLAGVTTATYQRHTSGNLEAALGAPCARLKKHIRSHGLRHR
ncbi:MAG: TIR domain-containing protein [Pirellulales bacterium]